MFEELIQEVCRQIFLEYNLSLICTFFLSIQENPFHGFTDEEINNATIKAKDTKHKLKKIVKKVMNAFLNVFTVFSVLEIDFEKKIFNIVCDYINI